jgi:lysozyme
MKEITAFNLLQRHEGWRSKYYKDSLGNDTIGYGFCLKYIELPKIIGKLWLQKLIAEKKNQLMEFDWFRDLDQSRQAVIIDLVYNIGINGVLSFKKMIAELKNKNYELAATEMLNSHWAEQVGSRATDLAAIVRGDDHNGI